MAITMNNNNGQSGVYFVTEMQPKKQSKYVNFHKNWEYLQIQLSHGFVLEMQIIEFRKYLMQEQL